jgi:putative MATE family efflux protein
MGFWANAIPAVISMLLTSSIVIVDGFFVGRFVGPRALAAVNLSLPILFLLLGLCMIVGVGYSTLTSMAIGAQKHEEASRLMCSALVLTALFCGGVLVACGLVHQPLLQILATDPGLRADLGLFLSTLLPGYLFIMMNTLFSIFARSEGRPGIALAIGLVANITNAFFDWLFIAHFDWGLRGAACASSLASLVGTTLAVVRIASGRSSMRFVKPSFPKGEALGALANGSSEGIGQWSFCLVAYFFNLAFQRTLGTEGLAALTVFGFINLIQSMVITGLCIGMAPLVGISIGSGQESAAREYRRSALRAGLIAGALCFVLAAFLGPRIAALYTRGNTTVTTLAATGFGFYALTFLPGAYNMVTSAYLTARRDAAGSAAVSLLRSLILPIAAILLLPEFWGARALWLASPSAEALTLAAAIVLTLRIHRQQARARFDAISAFWR